MDRKKSSVQGAPLTRWWRKQYSGVVTYDTADTVYRLATVWFPGESGQTGIVAYFSMEIAISPAMPTYSGGLGVLAGDTLRAAADTGLRLVAVTLAHRKGYFKQRLDENGVQSEEDQPWNLEDRLTCEEPVVTVLIDGRTVAIRAWRHDMVGITGHTIPIYLLDTDLEQNDPRTAHSPITFTVGMATIVYGRRRCWVLAGHACWRRSATAAHLPPERGARFAADDRIIGAPIAGEEAGSGNGAGSESRARALRIHHAHTGSCRARSLLDGAVLSHPGL